MLLVCFVWIPAVLAESNYTINQWHTKSSLEPAEQVLIQNAAAGDLQEALPTRLEDGLFYLRIKDGQNSHSFYEGYAKADFFEKTYAFKIPSGSRSKWVKTKLYRAVRSKAFGDEDEIYFDQNFIYSAYVPTLFYKENGKWLTLKSTSSKPGALLIQSQPSGAAIYYQGKQIANTPFKTTGYDAGVLTLTLKDSGYLPKTHLLRVAAGQVSSVSIKMVKFDSPVQPSFSTQSYIEPVGENVEPHFKQLTAVNQELLELLSQMKQLKTGFNQQYGSNLTPAPDDIDEWDNIEYIRYKEQYVQTRNLAFAGFSEKFKDRLAYLTKIRVQLKNKIYSIESRLDSIDLRPVAVKWKLLDSTQAQYGFKFKFQSAEGEHDFIYQATGKLTEEQIKSTLPLFQKNDTNQISYQVKFQNKQARIPNQQVILPRFYRYEKVQISHNGLPIALYGSFKLPPYITEFPEVDSWLHADKTNAQQRLKNQKEQAKILAQKRREIEIADYKELLEQLRGAVVELDSGFFVYNRKKVFLSSFAVNATEVTQEHYLRLTGKNPSRFKNPKKPVHNVTFDDAEAFCKTAGGSLPTEAQWEFAARAGTRSYFFWGDRSKDAEPYAIYRKNSLDEGIHSPAYGPQIVGSKRPNPWGLYDVAGNVKEWTKDYDGLLAFQLYTNSRNPTGLANLLGIWHERIFKGGSWRDEKKRLEHRKDDYEDPRYWADMLGFRCVYPSNQVLKKQDIILRINKYKQSLLKKGSAEKLQIIKDTLDLTIESPDSKNEEEVEAPEILEKESTEQITNPVIPAPAAEAVQAPEAKSALAPAPAAELGQTPEAKSAPTPAPAAEAVQTPEAKSALAPTPAPAAGKVQAPEAKSAPSLLKESATVKTERGSE